MNTLKPDAFFAEHYELIKLVDTGGFAEVWKAFFAGEIVALKIFPRLNEEGVEKVRSEYAQSKLLHTHLIVPSHYGVYENQPYLVMKFCEGGNASSRIEQSDEADLAKCLFHVSSALAYLHHKDYVHQDIKPNNILLDEDGDYYLTDLGLSMKLRQMVRRFTQGMKQVESDNSPRSSNSIGITPTCYRAPELDRNSSASKPPIKATDVWALGATIFEIATGDVPFGDAGGILQRVSPAPPDLPAKFSPRLNAVIKRCLSIDPWDRPKASDLEEWAGHYLKRGHWPEVVTELEPVSQPPVAVTPPILPSQMPAIDKSSYEPTIADKSKATVSETAVVPPLPAQEQNPVNGKPKRGSPPLWVLGIVIATGLGWVVYTFMNKEPGPVIPGPVIPDTSQNALPVKRDSDGDGVVDEKDDCKGTPKGTKVDERGCPSPPLDSEMDFDKDGVADDKDKCPGTPRGQKVNKYGCPVIPPGKPTKDSDGDGVTDDKDKCPQTPGFPGNNGCPITN